MMAAAAVVHRNKRPSPASDDGDDGCPANAGEKRPRLRFYYETTVEQDSDELHCSIDDDDDDYETVEEAYEFDSIDDYEILSDLAASSCAGGGGVATARDRCTGETVAVKRVPASEGDGGAASLRAVVREAACLAACRGHPSVLQLKALAADENTGDLFVVTEPPPLVGGGSAASTLRSRLTTRRAAISEAETRALMTQLLGAAAAMHAAGVTHRDISPDNILVGPGDGALKLCGFGCATTTATATTKHVVGEAEAPMGATRYRSPEQLYGGVARHGPEGDMWALGCVMAELLTGGGAPLFDADTEEGVLEQTIDLRDDIVMMGAVEAFDGVLDELSGAGRELLAGLLDFDSWERPAAADALKHRWFAEDDDDDVMQGLKECRAHDCHDDSIGTN